MRFDMKALVRRSQAVWADRRAVTALEYGIIASALAFVLIAIFANLSTPISQAILGVGSKI